MKYKFSWKENSHFMNIKHKVFCKKTNREVKIICK